VSMSRTWAASWRPIPRRVFTSPATAVLSRFLASQRLRIASVGLGWVAKNVMYLLTPSRSASCRQSLLFGVGGSSSRDRLCFTDKGILKGGHSAGVEPSDEHPDEEVVTLPRPALLRSETLATRANAASLSVTN